MGVRVCLLSVGVQVDLLVGGKPAVGLNKGGRLHFQPYLRKKGDEVHHENLESKDRHKVRGGGSWSRTRRTHYCFNKEPLSSYLETPGKGVLVGGSSRQE